MNPWCPRCEYPAVRTKVIHVPTWDDAHATVNGEDVCGVCGWRPSR